MEIAGTVAVNLIESDICIALIESEREDIVINFIQYSVYAHRECE